MKILFFLHPSFFSDRLRELEWIQKFAIGLNECGFQTTLFKSREHKIKDYDWVFVFSNTDPETLRTLKRAGARLLVIPSLFEKPPQPSLVNISMGKSVRLIRILLQKTLNPIEPNAFDPSNFALVLASTQEWVNYVHLKWKAKSEKIILLSPDPLQAGKNLSPYLNHQLT